MKILILVLSVFIVGCGGGGGSPEAPPVGVIPPPAPEPELYKYQVTIENESRAYTGKCVKTDAIYCYPSTIANSEFVVTAIIDGTSVKIFHFVTRELVLEFNTNEDNIYTLTLTEDGLAENGNINKAWASAPYIDHQLGQPLINLSFTNSIATGTDTLGCMFDGEASPMGNVYIFDVTVSFCDDAGEYAGAIHILDGNDIRGLITDGNKAILIDFREN